MPIQIIMTEGLIEKTEAHKLHSDVSQAFLDAHEISDNAFMLPNVIGEVVFVEEGLTFSGKRINPIAIVELRVPSFTFGTQRQKDGFVEVVTDIVLDATAGKLAKTSIWVNAVYAVDGLWGIAGKAYTNDELRQGIQQAAQ
ncbi:4-oxalocrotonate tautomerase [Pseudomonas sp. HK3]|jgi:phenylpyruvate tautomerase PptA (4-oxalocrotonate tautomerase family)